MTRRTSCLWLLGALLLLSVLPDAIEAQQRPARVDLPAPARAPSGCRVVASVLGGVGGAIVGALAGVAVERAVHDGEDAGVTGLAVGLVLGAGVGITLAPRACDDDAGFDLGSRLRAQVARRADTTAAAGVVAADVAWETRGRPATAAMLLSIVHP